MVITDDEEIYWNAKRFADRGKPFNSAEEKNLFLGLNYRMTEIEAVIGRVQLGKLNQSLERRRALAADLAEQIADMKAVRMGFVIPEAISSYWLLLLYVDTSLLTVSKEQFALAVASEGAPIDPHYDWIIYETPWFRNRANYGKSGCPWTCPFYGKEVVYEGSCPNARRAIDTHIIVHLHECYTSRDIKDMALALHKVESEYLKAR